MFNDEKTKWLNILHAGWPGGLVIAGIITIFIDWVPWWIKVGLIAVPALIYLVILMPVRFPVSERVSAGVTYREMLQEFGVMGATVVAILVVLQLTDFFYAGQSLTLQQLTPFLAIGAFIVVAFGMYTRTLGRPLMFVLVLIMMPLATTEIGTDGWITGIMEGVAKGKFHPGWVLVYTSVIMMILRFFAGPIIHALSPLGLLLVSSGAGHCGSVHLSFTTGMMIFAAATLYAVGKTFFWPTMLGVVSEQTPRGGALTLNAISGIGMLAVGTLGFPYIGKLQVDQENTAIVKSVEVMDLVPGLVKDGEISVLEDRSIYEVIKYKAISDDGLNGLIDELPESDRAAATEQVADLRAQSSQGALAYMTIFPAIMFVGYLGLIVYFQSRGGYKPVELSAGKKGD